jgi:hypothetical protein
VEAHRVVRSRGPPNFLDNRLTDGGSLSALRADEAVYDRLFLHIFVRVGGWGEMALNVGLDVSVDTT